MQPKVSVIIPVYNAEKYIERCARSLFEQTLDDIEYIFVDDCTPDNSFAILDQVLNDYPDRQSQVKIVKMSVNSKLPAARKAGMKAATGLYEAHCDPDDWLEKDAMSMLYGKAIETNADIVTCKFMIHKGSDQIISGYDFNGSGLDCLKSLQFDSPRWNKLVRHTLILEHQIFPFDGIISGEDMNVTVRALFYANKVTSVPLPLYHYNQNNVESITHAKPLQLLLKYGVENLRQIEDFFNSQNEPQLYQVVDCLKLREKRPLLWPWYGCEYRDIDAWCKLWPESHRSIKYNPEISAGERRILSKIANCPFLMKLYFKYLHFRNAD